MAQSRKKISKHTWVYFNTQNQAEITLLSKVHKKKFLPVHPFLLCFTSMSKIGDDVFMASQMALWEDQ